MSYYVWYLIKFTGSSLRIEATRAYAKREIWRRVVLALGFLNKQRFCRLRAKFERVIFFLHFY